MKFHMTFAITQNYSCKAIQLILFASNFLMTSNMRQIEFFNDILKDTRLRTRLEARKIVLKSMATKPCFYRMFHVVLV